MKTRKTKKLFYRKYPYRVELKCHGVNMLHKYGTGKVADFCTIQGYTGWRYKNFNDAKKSKLLELANLMGDYLEKGYKTRAENDKLHFYLEDKDSYEEIYNHFGKWVSCITAPASDSDLDKLFSKNFIVVCNKLAHDRYKFKVMLNSDKIAKDKIGTVYAWIQRHGEVYRMADTTKDWLSGSKNYVYDPYIYVESSQHLMMLQLYLGDAVKRTYEYVLRDTAINTVSEDNTCQP